MITHDLSFERVLDVFGLKPVFLMHSIIISINKAGPVNDYF